MKKFLFSIGSALGTAGITYALLPFWPAVVMCSVIFLHELGHFVVARATGAKAQWPLFIPLGIFIVGFTIVKDIKDCYRRFIAIAGPFIGMLTAGLLMMLGSIYEIPALVIASSIALCWEVFAGTLGSDGRRYRQGWKF